MGHAYLVLACSRRDARSDRDWSSDVSFFFSSRRRHTRSDRDWSSDVCSSDLIPPGLERPTPLTLALPPGEGARTLVLRLSSPASPGTAAALAFQTLRIVPVPESGALPPPPPEAIKSQIGRASCRERV